MRGVTKVQIEKSRLNIKDYLWPGALGLLAAAGQATVVLFIIFFLRYQTGQQQAAEASRKADRNASFDMAAAGASVSETTPVFRRLARGLRGPLALPYTDERN